MEHFPLAFGVETALLSTAAKKEWKWYRCFFGAAGGFMVKWHEDGAQLSWQRRASAVGSSLDNGGRVGQQEEWKETRPREWGQGGATAGGV